MRIALPAALGLASLFLGAQEPGPSLPTPLPPAPEATAAMPPAAPSPEDPLLAALIREALDRNPELARAQALLQAERQRPSQSRALPDPTLSVGLQNDGFRRLEVGRMESSYYQLMVSQGLPWPGKRALRGEIASLGAEAAHAGLARTRLSLEAEVRRAYTGLLLVRGQQALLAQQQILLRQAEELARSRYEVGQGAQVDLLRAQLESTRLQQRRWSLGAEEAAALAALNRLRGQALDTPVPTTADLESLPLDAESAGALMARAQRESPELLGAQTARRQAERSLDLARLDRRPDFGISAGVMPRGSLDPMWLVGVSVTLPVWGRQRGAVAEQEWRSRAQDREADSLRSILAQRIQERAAQMDAALGTLRIYREGLLVQSEASFRAALAQYESGRGAFLGALEALNGWIADRSGYLQALAQFQALRIAQSEFTLGATPAIGASTLGAGSMAGSSGSMASPAGSMASPSGSANAPSAPASIRSGSAPEGGAPPMKSM